MDVNLLHNLPHAHALVTGKESACFVVPLGPEDDPFLNFKIPGTNLAETMLHQLPFTSRVLEHDSELHSCDLHEINQRINFFF